MSGKTKRPSPQNMNARLDGVDAASVMVSTNGIMYGQKEIARVPNAAKKMKTIIGNSNSSRRYLTLTARTVTCQRANHGKDEQMRAVYPSMHHLKMFNQGERKDDNKKHEQPGR